MNGDDAIELAEKYKFGKDIDEKEYEQKFPYLNQTGIGSTFANEEDSNSENMLNKTECNEDYNNNNSNAFQDVDNNEPATVIVDETGQFFDLFELPQRENLMRLDYLLNIK